MTKRRLCQQSVLKDKNIITSFINGALCEKAIIDVIPVWHLLKDKKQNSSIRYILCRSEFIPTNDFKYHGILFIKRESPMVAGKSIITNGYLVGINSDLHR